MAYLVHDSAALIAMGDEDHEALAIQHALNQLDDNGLRLVQVVPQHRVFDEQGMSNGIVGPFYIFHDGAKQERPRPLSDR